MPNVQTEIGEIVSIDGYLVTVQLSNDMRSNMPVINGKVYRIGQIGSFLKIPLGYAILFGIVVQTGALTMSKKVEDSAIYQHIDQDNKQWLSMALVGEQISSKFQRGISQTPTTGDKVHLVTITDMDIIYGGYNEKTSITVGNVSISDSLDARIDLNKLVSRHCAIVGSTGSGKSNAVGVILNAIADKGYKNSRILVIDPHGEYNSVVKGKSIIYKIRADLNKNQKELLVPFWALPFNEFIALFSGNLTDSNREYIRQKLLMLKLNLPHIIK